MRFIGKAFLFLFAFVGILASLAIVLVVLLFSSLAEEDGMAGGEEGGSTVLTLNITGPFPERADPLDPLSSLFDQGSQPSLRAVTEAIAAAALDPDVRGLVAHIDGAPGLGMAQAQELRDAVRAFRASGKPTLAHAETIGEFGDGTVPYYLASSFDEIWLQPSGMVATTGFSFEIPYLRGLLDDLGIEPEVFTRKRYKDAMASLTNHGMSYSQRQSMTAVIDGWTNQVLAGIAEDRGLDRDSLSGVIDRSPLMANEALDAGLVDRLGYPDEVESAITEATGAEGRLPMGRYVARLADRDPPPDAHRVALVTASGPVMLGDGETGPFDDTEIDSRALAAAIDEAVDDPDLTAIVLRIDSPGGSYVGSDLVWRSIQKARNKGMPVVASMGDAAASGGYFIAMGADKVVAQPGTLTGSIGVLSGKVNIAKASEDIGLNWGRLSRGENADMFSATQPFDEAGRDRMNAIMDAIYADFTGKAATARGLSTEEMEAAAQGRVWLGSDAVEQGLVDELGGLALALARAREQAGLDPQAPIEVVPFPRDDTPDWLRGALGAAQQLEGLNTALSLAAGVDSLIGTDLAALRAIQAGPVSSPVTVYAR